MSLVGVGVFVFGALPIVKVATPFKYWSSIIIGAYTTYKYLTHLNNQHYE